MPGLRDWRQGNRCPTDQVSRRFFFKILQSLFIFHVSTAQTRVPLTSGTRFSPHHSDCLGTTKMVTCGEITFYLEKGAYK